TAAASDGETPWDAAIEPISEALTRSGVGYGGAVGLPWAGAPTGCCELVLVLLLTKVVVVRGDPVSRRTVPIRRNRFGSRPLAAARLETVSPALAAIAESVSP